MIHVPFQRVARATALRRMASVSTVCAVAMVGACTEPTSVSDASTFTADITGATTSRLTGTAKASAGGDWSRESVVQVTVPNGATFSGLVFSAAGGSNAISIIRQGADLALGTFRFGRGLTSTITGGYSAAYVVRRASDIQMFMADSGTATIAQNGDRVTGTFTLYVSGYDLLPLPSPELMGKPLTKLGSGTSPLTISGSFNAARR